MFARVEGFNIPQSSTSPSPSPNTNGNPSHFNGHNDLSRSHNNASPFSSMGLSGVSQAQHYPSSASFVDPAFIFNNNSHQLPSFSAASKSFSNSGSTALSDMDLFDEATLASLMASGSQNGTGNFNSNGGGVNGGSFSNTNHNPNAQHHSFGAAGTNGYLGNYPANALHQFLQSSAAARSPSMSAFSHPSPSDSRSPSAGIDLFAPSPSGGNVDSPANAGGDFGSYSSVGESISASVPNNKAATPTAAGTPGSTSKRRTSPSDGGRVGRTAHIGKAPNSSTRSRSARRAVPTAVPGASASTQPSSHPIAMSMPAYPSAPSPWFASAQAIQYSATPESNATADDVSGWRPSTGNTGVPSSAPVMGAKTKASKGLDDVQEEDSSAKQAALLTEKRRKRRESHNAVERRRRDNINDRITDLANLLPEALLDQVAASDDADEGAVGGNLVPTLDGLLGGGNMAVPASAERQAAANAKPNKGVVLAKSVEYIRYLQQLVELHQQRNTELESLVTSLRSTSLSAYPPPVETHANIDSPNGMMFSPSPAGDDSFQLWQGMHLKSEEEDDDRMLH